MTDSDLSAAHREPPETSPKGSAPWTSGIRDWRLHLAYPALARLPCTLAWQGATRLGRWRPTEREQARAAVRNGYLSAFPHLARDLAQLERWTQGYIDLFARESMDVFCMSRINAHNAAEHIHITGTHLLEEARRDGQGVILVLNHYSRLIMLLIGLGLMGHRMSMLTMRIDTENPDLTPPMRTFLRAKVERLLGFIGGQWLSIGDNLRPMLEGLRAGETWIVLADVYMPQINDWRDFPFLGGSLRLSRGIERIAARTGARLIHGVTHEKRPSHLECELRPLPADPAEAMATVVRELEQDILATPWEWWQWNIFDYIWTPAPTSD
ncbi:MAG: lysophospholipid acyltransferase family protein [Pseudomonadota bacterium]